MKTFKFLLPALIVLTFYGCTKDFLDAPPDKALLVPKKPDELAALLNNQSIMNTTPYLHLVAADDFYMTDAGYAASNIAIQNSYLWADDIFQGQNASDWTLPYQQVFYANVVLDGLDVLGEKDAGMDFNTLKGSAHFYRAMGLYHVSQQFAAPYNAATAKGEPGLPVPLSSDVNYRPGRGTLQELYDQILADLLLALDKVPSQVPFKNMPDKQTVNGMLARVYLQMNNYERAGFYAGQCLMLPHKLIDYNTVNGSPARPFVPDTYNGNEEVICQLGMIANSFTLASNTRTIVDSTLYRSYAANDLRKTLYFRDRGSGVVNHRGSYSSATFSGLAIDEIYLIRAECYARAGTTNSALGDLNTLLVNRYKKNTFIPLTASNADEALKLILQERRKELVGRGIRWSDLRRLNQDPRFALTLKRGINNKVYELGPKANKYVFPIPENELNASGIPQNPR